MRINEIASAEDQMALWRLVSDSVWQAIETQRQQALAPRMPVTTATASNASIAPKSGVFVANAAAAAKPEAWSRQA